MSDYSDLERPPLNVRFLRSRLIRPGRLWTQVDVLAETESTNAVVAAQARAGAPEGLLVAAEYQSAGKGRLGRTWTTPARSAVLMSALLRPVTVPPVRWPWLGLLAPLAVASAVRRVGELPAEVKWPNDVLLEDRKLAGILLERIDTPSGPAAIVGIGLNVTLRADERPHPQATSLALEGSATTDRVTVLSAVVRELATRYQAWVDAAGDPETILPDYEELSGTFGREVRVELPDGSHLEGTATGLDPDGRLLVMTDTGFHPLAAGDVTHLRLA